MTGFSSIVRGVADKAVREEGIGGPIRSSIGAIGKLPASSMPEISIRQGPAGRETLDVFEKEGARRRGGVRVTTRSAAVPTPPRRTESSVPDISVAYTTGGRETLAAIEQELGEPEPSTEVRERRTTLGFDERPLRDSKGRTMIDSAPEVITVEERPIGRTTLAAIAAEAADDGELSVSEDALDADTITALAEEARVHDDEPPRSAPRPTTGVEIHEVVTFVVHGLDPDALSSAADRREFVAKNLMHRLPVWAPDDVDRVDVSPADDGRFVVVQVLCRLTPGG